MSFADWFRASDRNPPLEAVPVDLLAAGLLTLLADAVVVTAEPGVVRFWAGATLLFVLPGYAVISALYPEHDAAGGDPLAGTAEFARRLALGFGLSLAMLPLLALVLWVAGLWIDVVAVLAVVSTVVFVASAVGVLRRLARPPSVRFGLPVVELRSLAGVAFGSGRPAVDRALNVALAASLLVAALTVGGALAGPGVDASYTTAALLSPTEGGEPSASGYPSEVDAGEPLELVVQLTNEGATAQRYVVVVRLERVEGSGADATVVESDELDRFAAEVGPGETSTVPSEVTPTFAGEDLRLSYFVYRGDAPAEPSRASAHRHLHVWVTVEGS